MCRSEEALEATSVVVDSKFNSRPVLQPTCNRVLDRRNSLKKQHPSLKPPSPAAAVSPTSPKSKSPRPPATKRANDGNNPMNSSSEKILIPAAASRPRATLDRKKSKSFKLGGNGNVICDNGGFEVAYASSLITESPGSIAAVRREQVALQQAQRKMRIAHYGRSKSARFEKIVPLDSKIKPSVEDRRCSFITPNSDPIYVAYHDEEWGVPVHDDKMLFELLVLSVAQVGSDWTSILKKRQDFRNAFSSFDSEIVANFSEKQMVSISTEYGIDINRVRGVVDNSIRILQIKKEFGSFDKYIWGFVNNKPFSPQYKSGHKIPVKTSKSETISKDMVRRGFRSVGPTVVHSFMQAAGLTNDHLTTCHRHLHCTLIAAGRRTPAPTTTTPEVEEDTAAVCQKL
ncbi:putative GMP synthase [Cucumis melo var. makuwa]|uniref:GMP synthase n=2 Tax=Cucumis melo TaxID=3656 RepID=A0A5A7UM21_CUCMM|nr:putative GMP synthase [Cucumis melo var. makuwa]TYJ95615.1 putative GMP synthase [Cucumis melo var. makuwa]